MKKLVARLFKSLFRKIGNDLEQRFGLAGPMDVLTKVHYDFQFDDLYGRSVLIDAGGTLIRLISIRDLRELKIRTGRLKDLDDVLMSDRILEKGFK